MGDVHVIVINDGGVDTTVGSRFSTLVLFFKLDAGVGVVELFFPNRTKLFSWTLWFRSWNRSFFLLIRENTLSHEFFLAWKHVTMCIKILVHHLNVYKFRLINDLHIIILRQLNFISLISFHLLLFRWNYFHFFHIFRFVINCSFNSICINISCAECRIETHLAIDI